METPDKEATIYIQERWNQRCANAGREPLKADGVWGPKTAEAVTTPWLIAQIYLAERSAQLASAKPSGPTEQERANIELGEAFRMLLEIASRPS